MPTLTRQSRYILLVVLGAWFGLVALPWYGVAHGFWSFSWLADPIDPANGSGLVQALLHVAVNRENSEAIGFWRKHAFLPVTPIDAPEGRTQWMMRGQASAIQDSGLFSRRG